MNRRIFCQVLASSLLTGSIFQSDLLASEQIIDISAPDKIYIGQPFLCGLQSRQIQNLSLVWNNKKLGLNLYPHAGLFQTQCLLGVGLGSVLGQHKLQIRYIYQKHKKKQAHNIQVENKKFPVQKLSLPKNKVSLSKKDLNRHWREKAQVKKALALLTAGKFWEFPFKRPVPGAMSSAFGLRRILNGKPRASHKGVDFRGIQGEPVISCNNGMVGLTGNHFFAGNSVYIDHGQGVVSMYFHLDKIEVNPGDIVRSGQVIGRVGSTGRSTGAHLHFGISILGQLVDPMPLLESKLPGGLHG